MEAEVAHKESSIKREITKIYKSVIGKGPESTEVKIFQNFLFMKFVGAFTPIEESLMNTPNGLELVEKIRGELILKQTADYIPFIESVVEEKAHKISYIMEEKNNTIYIFILFAGIIDK